MTRVTLCVLDGSQVLLAFAVTVLATADLNSGTEGLRFRARTYIVLPSLL